VSYWTYLDIDTGGIEPLSVEIGNMTSNVSGMWSKCLTAALDTESALAHLKGADARRMVLERPDVAYYRDNLMAFEERLSLRDVAGQRAADLVPLLVAAVAWGFEHLDDLRDDNPENGWGNAEGALTYLLDIKDACAAHPTGILVISS
jgi:hypothetical protein